MLYIKIGGEKYAAKIQTFLTQTGAEAIRVISDAPLAKNGFLIVDDNDNVISDKSAYKYLYCSNDNCKEYTADIEEQIPTECYYMGDVPPSVISQQIKALNNRINAMQPYTDTKKAYYGEIEKVFYGVPNGNVSIFFDNYDGEYSTSRTQDRFIVSFPRLEGQTNITVMVQ